MPLVQWVDDGFDGAADAMNRTDDSFWSVDATTGPPCGFCISWKAPSQQLAAAAAATNRRRETVGLRRFLQALERVRNRRRRMWIELRGAHFTARGAGRNDRHGHHHNNDDDFDDDELLRRLFGNALPRHPLLDELRIVRCHLEDANDITLRELCRGLSVTALHEAASPYPRNGSSLSPPIPTRAIATSCLRTLHLNGSCLGGDALDSLAHMLASNAASSLLSLAVMDCDFGAANTRACNDLLLALEGNTHLINLRLAFPDAERSGPVSREAATALGKSNVQCLKLRNQHPSTAPSILYGLRSNRTLEELHLSVDEDDEEEESTMVVRFQDLVKTFNFVLREVRLYRDGFVRMYPTDQQRHFEPWLQRRNVAVRSAYQGLVGWQFRVRQLSLWDRAMDRLSSKPDLLYRFLRVGNLDLLDRHLGTGPPKQQQTTAPLRRTRFVSGGTGGCTYGNYQVIFL